MTDTKILNPMPFFFTFQLYPTQYVYVHILDFWKFLKGGIIRNLVICFISECSTMHIK